MARPHRCMDSLAWYTLPHKGNVSKTYHVSQVMKARDTTMGTKMEET